MNKLKIIFFLSFSLTSYCKDNTSLVIRNKVIELISNHYEISVENKIKLIAQCALETGHFKHIRYKNNVFNMKEKKNKKYSYAKYKTLEESITKRIKLFIRKNHKFTKDYATNPDYSKLLAKVLKYVKKNYNLTLIKNHVKSRKLFFSERLFKNNSFIIPYRYRFA